MEGLGSGGSEGDSKVDAGAGRPTVAPSLFEGDHVVTEALAAYEGRPQAPGPEETNAAGLDPAATAALIEVASGLEGLVGFRLAEQIVRKEQVTVFKSMPGLATAPREAPPTSVRS